MARMNLSSKVADKLRSASMIVPGPRLFQTVSMRRKCMTMWSDQDTHHHPGVIKTLRGTERRDLYTKSPMPDITSDEVE